MAGPSSQPSRHSQSRPHSVPSWIDELPRDYPQPPPVRAAPPPRTQFGQFQRGTSVTPGNSISQVDRQSPRSPRQGRTVFDRDDMPRGTPGLVRQPDWQVPTRGDERGFDQRQTSLYRPNDSRQPASGPQPPQVVNNYITTNNHQQYNVDNSRHQRVNAQGQANTQNIRHHSVTHHRRDTFDNSRTSQRLSSSGLQHHRQSRHNREHRG